MNQKKEIPGAACGRKEMIELLETGEEKDSGKGEGIGGAEVVWVASGEKGEISPEERTCRSRLRE